MPFLIICKDKKDSLKKRLAVRPEHICHLKSLKKKLLMAGPILNKNKEPIGSILIIDLDERSDLNNFLRKDPYSKAELFKEITVHKFKRVF